MREEESKGWAASEKVGEGTLEKGGGKGDCQWSPVLLRQSEEKMNKSHRNGQSQRHEKEIMG